MKIDNLSDFQRRLVLSLFPEGAQVVEAEYYQREYLPCPMRVGVCLPDGGRRNIVLRLSRMSFGVEREANLLPVLSRLGLPVPKILAGPVRDPASETSEPMTLLSLLPGENLQNWSCASSARRDRGVQLVIKAVERLHQLTEPLSREDAVRDLPRRDMTSELNLILNRESSWLNEPVFLNAVNYLKPIVAAIRTPLCFSNGDYQPGNFLSDGKDLTGFVDFENACFEDPHIGVAKYRIYDLHPLNKARLVERYLKSHNLSEQDFAPRMAVRCLWTLQREVPVSEKNQPYGTHILKLLYDSLKLLGWQTRNFRAG